MGKTDRRDLLPGLAFAGGALAPQTSQTQAQVIYDDGPNECKIVVVAHGQGAKPLLATFERTQWENDMPNPMLFERDKIDQAKAKTKPFIKWVPSCAVSPGEPWVKGFGHVKVG